MLTPNLPRGGRSWCGDVRRQAGRAVAQRAHQWKQRFRPMPPPRAWPSWSWWATSQWHPELAALEQRRMRVQGLSDEGE